MTLKKEYKQLLVVSPNLPNNYVDDSTFAHIFVIPDQYKTITIGTNDAIDYESISNSSGSVGAQTIDLVGTMNLTSSSVYFSGIANPNTKLYFAGFNTNSVVFDYVDDPLITKKSIAVGDTILTKIITKVVNLYNKSNYLEYSGNLSFVPDQIVNISGVNIRVLAGSGIVDRCGVIGLFSTDFKEISYFAKFNLPKESVDSGKLDTSFISAFSNSDGLYNQYINKNSVSTEIKSDNRLEQLKSSILNPTITNLSSVDSIPTYNTNNNYISGTSNSLTIKSWRDIPNKTDMISFGVSNMIAKNSDITFYQNFNMDITVNFDWYYTPVPVTNVIDDIGIRLVDNWLVHTYTTPPTFGNTNSNIPPAITYLLDSNGYPSLIQYTNQITNNTKSKYTLFAVNGVVYRTGTHAIDYNTEFDNIDTTEYYGVQNKCIIPCRYSFDVKNIQTINNIGDIPDNLPKYKTKLTADFSITDTTISVENTDDFLNIGYIQLVSYTIIDDKTFILNGVDTVYYTSKDSTHFYGVSGNTRNYRLNKYPIEITQKYPI
jgi:hypothetical protein